MNNICLIPYSVKCICKIILSLVKKENPNLNIIEQNILISRFFFNKLLLPIFRNPGYGAFINNFIISDTTIHNLDIVSKIIERLISGSFINNEDNNCDYSPFNFYFLEKMPMILKFFENITKVTLPSFIDKLINGDLPDDFKYDYFKENPKEIVFHRAICFSIDDFFAILSNMEKCQNILFNNERSNLAKTFKMLNSETNKELIETLRNINDYEFIFDRKRKKEKKGKKILNYFLFFDILVNEYVKIFEINQKSPNFIIKEMRIFQNEKDNQINSIIRVKNYLSSLLYNYRPLVKTDFDEGTTQNTIKILNELKKFMKSSNFVG